MYIQIKTAREKLHLSSDYIARKLHIPKECFEDFENGKGYINFLLLQELFNNIYGNGVIEFLFSYNKSEIEKLRGNIK